MIKRVFHYLFQGAGNFIRGCGMGIFIGGGAVAGWVHIHTPLPPSPPVCADDVLGFIKREKPAGGALNVVISDTGVTIRFDAGNNITLYGNGPTMQAATDDLMQRVDKLAKGLSR